MRYRTARPLLLLLGIIIGSLLCACSNSDGVDYANYAEITTNSEEYWNTKVDYLPLDDTEYPYAGIPRIVIETENHQEIKDRETEIPAKLQIWGKTAPESEVMNLTIKGRGNSTWTYPKKPYTIKFSKKQAFLGMPKAKKWVMLANYRDRTLIRNAIALEIARKTSQNWVPQGRFADVFFNDTFIGNYYICEKIEVTENRLNLNSNGYLLEFDKHYDEEFQFRTSIGEYPTIIKFPKNPTDEQFQTIQTFINNFIESVHYQYENKHININSFVDYFIVNEIAQNSEIQSPKSFFSYIDNKGNLTAGPVWDFDYLTFMPSRASGWYGVTQSAYYFNDLRKDKSGFNTQVRNLWPSYSNAVSTLPVYIDSLANHIRLSEEFDANMWWKGTGDQTQNKEHNYPSFQASVDSMKVAFTRRLTWMNDNINSTFPIK